MDGIAGIYAQDSFFTLSVPGQIGLGCLSLALAIGLVMLVRRAIHGRGVIVRLFLALMAIWSFVWLSPQIYYAYYLMIVDGLPVQWVIAHPTPLMDLAKLLGFSQKNDLSHHGQGLLGWILIVVALWPQGNAPRR